MRWLRNLFFVHGLLLIAAAPLAAQERPQDSPEFQALLHTSGFDGAATGDGGDAGVPVLSLRLLLSRPSTESRPLFLELIERAKPGGQLYALCGLYLIDRPLFEECVKPFLSDEREIEYCPVGCSVTLRRVKEIVRSRSRWAVRLPQSYAGTDWRPWVKEQDWPKRARPAPDIVGGAFPVEVGRHRGWGHAHDPQRTLGHWVRELNRPEADRDDAEKIAYAIAKFGDPGFVVARRLASSHDAKLRLTAAAVIFSMGVEQLGPKAEEAAGILGRLLHDADLGVATWAGSALYVLSPWIRSAHADIVKALERLQQRASVGEGAMDHVLYVIDPLGLIAGEAAVPALVELLESRHESIRCAAGCALGELGPTAAPARPALARILTTSTCALEALRHIGVEPGSDEMLAVVTLLRGEDADRAVSAAHLLGDLGPKAGLAAASEIAAALEAAREAEAIGDLAYAHWQITGQTEGLVARLVAALATGPARDYPYGGGKLQQVLERHPALTPELVPFLYARDTATRMAAQETLRALGKERAAPLVAELQRSAQMVRETDADALSAGLALHELAGDSGLLLRVGRRLLQHEPRRGLDLLRRLGAAAAPLVDDVLKLEGLPPPERRFRLRVLAAMGSAADTKTVPAFQAAVVDRETVHDGVGGLERLSEAGSKVARAALERLANLEGDALRKSLAQEALDELRD